MKKALTLILIVLGVQAHSQTYWSEDAAQVFYDNCTACHNPNGIGPNSLMTYGEAVTYAPLIQSYVGAGIMPPWTADTGYVHYSQERILTQAEKDIILDWISDGTLEGDPAQAPPPPVYNGDQILPGTPDLVVTAPNYMSKATTTEDDYVCFAIPSGLAQNRKVKAIEVIPGNRQTVHHCLVYSDNTGFAQTDSVGGDCAGPVTSTLMGGYTPGATPIIFPSTGAFSAGMTLESGTDIVLAMHYPAGSYGEWDQTKVNFYFYDEPVANFREVSCDPIVQDWGFSIPANTFDSIAVATSPIPADYTMMSVFPHMHLLGDYIQSWGITPLNDSLPFTRIPNWDFDWQDFYWFQFMQKVPAGTVVHGKGVWNNTVTNPHNPNNPPQTVGAGLNTSDEMFLIYFHYMPYQTGDELINIDSLTTEFLSMDGDYAQQNSPITIFPNPFTEETNIMYYLNQSDRVSVYIYDVQGRLINRLVSAEQQVAGTHQIAWDGSNLNGEDAKAGMYFYSIRIGVELYSGRIIRH